MSNAEITPFTIAIPDASIEDLQRSEGQADLAQLHDRTHWALLAVLRASLASSSSKSRLTRKRLKDLR